jgi:phenylacetate-CoA ligase
LGRTVRRGEQLAETSVTQPPKRNAALEVLRQVERYSLPDLVMYQARRLGELLRHAHRHVPYYRDRLPPLFDSADVLDLSRWYDVPLLTPAEAKRNKEALHAVEVPASAGAEVADQTSGTGGEPFRFVRSGNEVTADAANSLRIFFDHGFDPEARFADIRLDIRGKAQYPEGAVLPTWAFGFGKGDYVILDINTPLEGEVDWLLRRKPSLLFTWAQNARSLALAIESRGERLPLTAMATSAEIQTAAVRRDCRRVFGAEPVDILGAREIGILAWRCHAGPHYHLAAETAWIEVLAEDGSPAEPGVPGRLAATPFYGYHMPFIRYATGDFVTLGDEPCACGRSLPTLSAFNGRDRMRLRRRIGSPVFPNLPEAELDTAIGPLQWRLVQRTLDRIEVIVEPSSIARAQAAEGAVRAAIEGAFAAPFEMTIVAAEPLPPGVWRKKRELFRSDLP